MKPHFRTQDGKLVVRMPARGIDPSWPALHSRNASGNDAPPWSKRGLGVPPRPLVRTRREVPGCGMLSPTASHSRRGIWWTTRCSCSTRPAQRLHESPNCRNARRCRDEPAAKEATCAGALRSRHGICDRGAAHPQCASGAGRHRHLPASDCRGGPERLVRRTRTRLSRFGDLRNRNSVQVYPTGAYIRDDAGLCVGLFHLHRAVPVTQ